MSLRNVRDAIAIGAGGGWSCTGMRFDDRRVATVAHRLIRTKVRTESALRSGFQTRWRYPATMDRTSMPPSSLRGRASAAGRSAGGHARDAGEALVELVGALVHRAIDRMLLTDDRVTSAAEGKRLLAGEEEKEAVAGDIQRVVVLSATIVRRLLRGARLAKVPWVMVASSALSVGVSVRTGVHELRILASLVAHRLEQAGGARGDPALVKKLAIDLYLHPKRAPQATDDTLHLVRLTRKWVLSGAFGRKTSKRAAKALDAAERLDVAELSARWAEARSRSRRPGEEHPPAESRSALTV